MNSVKWNESSWQANSNLDKKIMKKPSMKSTDFVKDNISRIATIFPDCVTEAKDEKGQIRRMIDFDILRQELAEDIFEGGG